MYIELRMQFGFIFFLINHILTATHINFLLKYVIKKLHTLYKYFFFDVWFQRIWNIDVNLRHIGKVTAMKNKWKWCSLLIIPKRFTSSSKKIFIYPIVYVVRWHTIYYIPLFYTKKKLHNLEHMSFYIYKNITQQEWCPQESISHTFPFWFLI